LIQGLSLAPYNPPPPTLPEVWTQGPTNECKQSLKCCCCCCCCCRH
jgi:hypothetical protein